MYIHTVIAQKTPPLVYTFFFFISIRSGNRATGYVPPKVTKSTARMSIRARDEIPLESKYKQVLIYLLRARHIYLHSRGVHTHAEPSTAGSQREKWKRERSARARNFHRTSFLSRETRGDGEGRCEFIVYIGSGIIWIYGIFRDACGNWDGDWVNRWFSWKINGFFEKYTRLISVWL